MRKPILFKACFSFFALFLLCYNVFASEKAYESAHDYFSKEKDTKWFAIIGIVIVCALFAWLVISARRNNSKKTKKG